MLASIFNLGRWMRSRTAIVVTLAGLLVIFFFGPSFPSKPPPHPSKSLHFLVPATSSNENLCRLLLSSSILNYPVPVLINWGAAEAKDAYVQHLAKVWTILAYLEILSSLSRGSDLVLIVDGFDIHFQLPPEVLLKRYFQENERANKRIEKLVGVNNTRKYGYEQTVIFGHDKVCWPVDGRRPACWAVPEASDPPMAYGPNSGWGLEKTRARWLNSGTVMGTVDGVRDVFKATLDLIHQNHTTDSDQFYFANVFAKQEYAKRLLEKNPFKGIKKEDVDWLDILPGEKTEYGIGLDYEAVLFQTMAFFREYITWMRFDGRPSAPIISDQKIMVADPYYEKVLPADIKTSRSPFYAAIKTQNSRFGKWNQTIPTHLSWEDLKLGINVISNQIFPLLHFTGPKEFRALWWPRLWFLPWAEELLKASTRLLKMPREPILREPIGGTIWWPAEMDGLRRVDLGDKGGSFADNGTFLGWGQLCGIHEDVVFGKRK